VTATVGLVDFKDKGTAGYLLGTYRGISRNFCEGVLRRARQAILGVPPAWIAQKANAHDDAQSEQPNNLSKRTSNK